MLIVVHSFLDGTPERIRRRLRFLLKPGEERCKLLHQLAAFGAAVKVLLHFLGKPQSIDWRDTVGRHPMLSVASVGLVGYLVGRTKGASIMAGITAALSAGIIRQLSDVFEGEFFDF